MVHSTRALALAGLLTAVFACSSSSETEDADEGALESEKEASAEPVPADGGSRDAEAGARTDGSGGGDSTTEVECTDNAGCEVTDDPAICGPAQCIEGRCIFSFC